MELAPLWEHQKRAIEMADAIPSGIALFMEPGTGKTRTTIEILRRLFTKKKELLPTIIFCPPVVIVNWKDEFLKYSKIGRDKITLLTGPGKKRCELYRQFQSKSIFITNYESINMGELLEAFLEFPPKVLILDESHMVKDPKTKRTKKMIKLADRVEHTYILSGTPVANSQMDIFSQFRCLDRGETFGKNFAAFRAQYFWDKNEGMSTHNYFPNWVPRTDTNQHINTLIARKSVVAKKSQCLDLPPFLRSEIAVEMSQLQAKHYAEMKKDFVTYLNSDACVAKLALTKALRLQEIVSGYIPLEGGKNFIFPDTPRMKALEEKIEEITAGHKMIIWARFRANHTEIAKLCARMGKKYALLVGGTDEKETFRQDSDTGILIASQGAGGTGVNLIEASYGVYYSRSFSLIQDEQSEARNYRGGSEVHESVTRIDLVARGTTDELGLKALRLKKDMSESILDLKNYMNQF